MNLHISKMEKYSQEIYDIIPILFETQFERLEMMKLDSTLILTTFCLHTLQTCRYFIELNSLLKWNVAANYCQEATSKSIIAQNHILALHKSPIMGVVLTDQLCKYPYTQSTLYNSTQLQHIKSVNTISMILDFGQTPNPRVDSLYYCLTTQNFVKLK
jgi:hypothetical protein